MKNLLETSGQSIGSANLQVQRKVSDFQSRLVISTSFEVPKVAFLHFSPEFNLEHLLKQKKNVTQYQLFRQNHFRKERLLIWTSYLHSILEEFHWISIITRKFSLKRHEKPQARAQVSENHTFQSHFSFFRRVPGLRRLWGAIFALCAQNPFGLSF